MLTAADIKNNISMVSLAERLGYTPDRFSKILCPFHNDKKPSLKVYPEPGRGFYCFACNTGGSVIDFMMRVCNLDYKDAVKKLGDEFGLSQYETDPSVFKKAQEKREAHKRQQQLLIKQIDALCDQHRECFLIMKDEPPLSDKFCEAAHKITEIEHQLEVLQCQQNN